MKTVIEIHQRTDMNWYIWNGLKWSQPYSSELEATQAAVKKAA